MSGRLLKRDRPVRTWRLYRSVFGAASPESRWLLLLKAPGHICIVDPDRRHTDICWSRSGARLTKSATSKNASKSTDNFLDKQSLFSPDGLLVSNWNRNPRLYNERPS